MIREFVAAHTEGEKKTAVPLPSPAPAGPEPENARASGGEGRRDVGRRVLLPCYQ